MNIVNDLPREWLETDGLGGFAIGTEPGHRTRRYHALLCAAARPPVGRVVLVNGLEVWIERTGQTEPLSTQIYEPGVVQPDGHRRIESFQVEPWPKWTFRLDDGSLLTHELFMTRGRPLVALRWSMGVDRGEGTLCVRPLLSGRDYHHLQGFNRYFKSDSSESGDFVKWRPYPDLPAITVASNGSYTAAPQWYYQFLYVEERRRGMDCVEDLASPGVFRFELANDAILMFSSGSDEMDEAPAQEQFFARRQDEEVRRRSAPSAWHRAAEAYLVKRGAGSTIIAGYPWFSDWGRDTFIAMRGLCLATGRLAEARDLLLTWSGVVSEGMLPNRFMDDGTDLEYNSVDASLWFVIAAGEFLKRCGEPDTLALTAADRECIEEAIEAILDGYARGTRFGIHLAEDGLIAAGEPGVQLTWMDAKMGDWVVTPRIGKPVEIQALWLNALRVSSRFEEKWSSAWRRGLSAFRSRFWNRAGQFLYDVVDLDHEPGKNSADFRPNQLFAVGGLPDVILPPEEARQVIAAAEQRLWTPWGPRSLSPNHPDYQGRYLGDIRARDGAYHQGTVWPWLAGAFIEGFVRVHGGSDQAKRHARTRFLDPLLEKSDALGIGHLAELADGDLPHWPRGCPFQAWSVAEALRLSLEVLDDSE